MLQTHLQELLSVLNAQLINKKHRYDTITATMHDMLHWLLIQKRMEYKLFDFVYKAVYHNAPVYLTEVCVTVSTYQGHAHLRSVAECSIKHIKQG